MLELRILSGYHRGATLPLDGEVLSLGSDEDADVVLADPGLAARHAQLSQQDGRWVLTPQEGLVRDSHSNAAQEQVWLDEGGLARVGAIWLAVCEADSPWQDPPPEPTDVAAPSTGQTQDAGMPEQAGDAVEELGEEPQDAREPDPAPASEEPVPAPVGRSRGLRMILVPVAAVAVLSAAAAYALSSHPEPSGQELIARAASRAAMDTAPQRLPPDQLQAALRKRLGEIDLLWRVTLELQDSEWTIRGALNDEESERLQRMLRSFAQRYVVDFPVNVRIGSAESMLPFRIIQVISGNDPSIVTDDGRRLYVGDEYRGVRLAAVAGNQLRFTGKHNLDIVW